MTINSDVDIPLAIEKLGLSKNEYKLSSSVPPHNIVEWKGSDSRPSDDQINTAWTNWKAQDKYKGDREASYPNWKDQLDKIYHSGIDAWKADIKAIKDKYPKP